MGFFVPKMVVSWRITVFPKMPCWNPYFYSVFWVRAFWAKLSKKGLLDTPSKKKILTDNWKLFFWYFVFFTFSFFVFLGVGGLFFVLFLEGLRVRWGGPKGHLTWPKTLLFSVFVLFFLFFGGFKGQVRWPEGPPHLALNPPYFFFVLFCFCFLFFLSFFWF